MLKRLSFGAAFGAVVVFIGLAAPLPQRAAAGNGPRPASKQTLQVNDCSADGYAAAAEANAETLHNLRWAPFGRAELGWEIYARRIQGDLGSECSPESTGFAKAVAQWQVIHDVPADGILTGDQLMRMKAAWQEERPYVALRARGVCPEPPQSSELVRLTSDETYRGKAVMLRADVAKAYREMIAAARAEDPQIAGDMEALDIFSGYRSPAYDDARCARDRNCGGVTRAQCSVHRTGTAFDLVVGASPGQSVDSTNDQNRLHMTKTPAYRWLVANGARFGFVNYAFEPWHWEYRGDAAELDRLAVR